jgi:CheY-like chemotaxis protein
MTTGTRQAGARAGADTRHSVTLAAGDLISVRAADYDRHRRSGVRASKNLRRPSSRRGCAHRENPGRPSDRGYAQGDTAARAFEAGAVAFLEKPIDLTRRRAEVDRLVGIPRTRKHAAALAVGSAG